jgi:hypothetical protein
MWQRNLWINKRLFYRSKIGKVKAKIFMEFGGHKIYEANKHPNYFARNKILMITAYE